MTWLQTVPGGGPSWALTMALDTGTMERFEHGGDVASYGRGGRSQRLSTGKVTGRGTSKNGHPYLGWAFGEVATFAIRLDAESKRFSPRRRSKRHQMVALKTVAHQWARACYDILREHVPLERATALGSSRALPEGWGRELAKQVGLEPCVLSSHAPSRQERGRWT
jgi:transposase